MDALIGTVIGVGAGVVLAVSGWSWRLSGRMSKTEQKIDDLPAVLNGTVIRKHEGRCANFDPQETTGVKIQVLK